MGVCPQQGNTIEVCKDVPPFSFAEESVFFNNLAVVIDKKSGDVYTCDLNNATQWGQSAMRFKGAAIGAVQFIRPIVESCEIFFSVFVLTNRLTNKPK